MEIANLASRSFPNKEDNVFISNQTNCPIILLQIWNLKTKFPVVSLQPNSTRGIPLPAGSYRFDFTFANTEEEATLSVEIKTPTETVTDSGSASVGRRGLLAPVATV